MFVCGYLCLFCLTGCLILLVISVFLVVCLTFVYCWLPYLGDWYDCLFVVGFCVASLCFVCFF